MTHKSLLMSAILFAIASPAIAQQTPAAQSAAPPAQAVRPSPFERADANRDGVITLEEVRVARTTAFTRLDVNRDGFLVREEMRPPHMGRRGEHGPEGPQPRGEGGVGKRKEGARMLGQADTNNDGNVTRAEFDAASTRAQAANASTIDERRSRAFARLDTNSDGMITRAEAEAARRHGQEGHMSKGGADQRHNGNHPNPDTNNDQRISLPEWLARPDPLFERGDTNNDGRVTREEAAAFMRQGRGEGERSRRPW